VALSAGACSRACSKASSAGSQGGNSSVPSASAIGEISGDTTELVGAGSAPRIDLGVERWAGLRWRLTSSARSSLGIEGRRPVTGPLLTTISDFEVVRGSADPVRRLIDGVEVRCVEELGKVVEVRIEALAFARTGAGSPGAQRASWLDGTSARLWTSERGTIVDADIETVGEVTPDATMKESLKELVSVQRRLPFVLPAESVGVGARWKLKQEIEVRGASATQETELELRSFDARAAQIHFRSRLTAPRQSLPHPERMGELVTLERLRGDVEGDLSIDRLTGIFRRASLALTASLTVTTEAQNRITYVSSLTGNSTGTLLDGDAAAASSASASAAGTAAPANEDDDD
jgi:hypothetical protein